MDALRETLIRKIKTLNETVWERRASDPAVNEWLDNFKGTPSLAADERIHALYVLSNFMYFGNRQIRELLKAVYRDLYKYPIVETLRRANQDTIDSAVIDPLFDQELARSRFLGMGNPAESGCHLLYYFRQENRLHKNLFIHTHQIFRGIGGGAKLELRDSNVSRYIFIDDFCGSGKQGVAYSQEIVEEIKRLNPNAFVAYYVLFATTKGMEALRTQTAFDAVKAVYELDASFRCFSPESRYFRTKVDGINASFCETMCRGYGQQMLRPEHALGFDDSQLLIGFYHNTPDNSLPIIWFDEPNGFPWKPIFRRYPKIELVSA